MAGPREDFAVFFRKATGCAPYPYQAKLAESPIESRLISVPTGAGKTAAAILAWLYQRSIHPEKTPRRLVYCLPMRVLVEQTRDGAREWVEGLKDSGLADPNPAVHTVMGGEVEEDWELYPERPAILVGTQDMLFSPVLSAQTRLEPRRIRAEFPAPGQLRHVRASSQRAVASPRESGVVFPLACCRRRRSPADQAPRRRSRFRFSRSGRGIASSEIVAAETRLSQDTANHTAREIAVGPSELPKGGE